MTCAFWKSKSRQKKSASDQMKNNLTKTKRQETGAPIAKFLRKHYVDILAVLLIAGFLISGILTLHEYSINWDESLGNMFFAERYQYYFRTFDIRYLDFNTPLPYLSSLPLNLFAPTIRYNPIAFPPIFDISSSISMHLVSYKLHLLDPVDAYHLPIILYAAFFLCILYCFLSKRVGKPTALMTIAFMAFFPRFYGDMHFNGKDIPETISFGLSLITYLRWYEKKTWGRTFVAGLAFGLALAMKINALFLPLIWVLGVWQFKRIKKEEFWRTVSQFILQHVIMIVMAFHVFLLTWPYLWSDPNRIIIYFRTYITQGDRVIQAYSWNFKPLLMVLTMSPEIFVIFFLAGIGFAIWRLVKDRDPLLRLFLVWCFVPLIRICLPGMVNFDGIRHFLEFLPAACFLAAYAIRSLATLLSKKKAWMKLATGSIVGVLFVTNILLIFIRYHPYEYLYYNSFIGARKNAGKIFSQDELSDYWAITYRKGLAWLDENVEQHSYLNVPLAARIVEITKRIWLRQDIVTIDANGLKSLEKSDADIYVMFVTRPVFYDDIAKYCVDNLTPVYEIDLLSTPLLVLYHWDVKDFQ
jgi:hypothetical protein